MAEFNQRGPRILVVDDYAGTREVLMEVLGRGGWSVQSAPDGQQAWSLLSQEPFFYDVVITDLNMPVMDGLELLQKIRERSFPPEVILLTGSPGNGIVARARALRAFAVLTKPFQPDILMRTVERALARHAREGRSHETNRARPSRT